MPISACSITGWLVIGRGCGFFYATQETTKHALWSCLVAQQVWNKVLSLFLMINVGCLFSWGATMWRVLRSILMLYEAYITRP